MVAFTPNLYSPESDPRCQNCRVIKDRNRYDYRSSKKEVFQYFAKQLILLCRELFSKDPEKRKILHQLRVVVARERRFSNALKDTFVRPNHNAKQMKVFAAEHDFLESLSQLHKLVHPQSKLRGRLFPSELLEPYHFNVEGQRTEQRPGHIKPGDTISDFSSDFIGDMGFAQLYWKNSPGSIDHYTFVQAINPKGEEVLEKIRDVRSFVLSNINYDSAKIDNLKIGLECLETAWKEYEEAAPALQEAGDVLSQKDYFAPFWQEEQKKKSSKSRDMLTPCSKDLETDLLNKFPGTTAAKMIRDHTLLEASEKVQIFRDHLKKFEQEDKVKWLASLKADQPELFQYVNQILASLTDADQSRVFLDLLEKQPDLFAQCIDSMEDYFPAQ